MNFFIPIYSGSEYRQFFLSGIVKRLIDSGNIVYTMVKDNFLPLSNEIIQLDKRIQILKYIDKDVGPSLYTHIQKFLRVDFERNYHRWQYTSVRKERNNGGKKIYYFLSYLLNDALRDALIRFSLLIAKFIKLGEAYYILSGYKIDRVILNTTRSEFTYSILIYALQHKIPVVVLYHTNKEATAQNRILYPYKMLGVWNEEMLDTIKLRNNIFMPPAGIVGNTHFEYLFTNTIISKSEFDVKFKVPKNKSFILFYTAASNIIENEQLIVEAISTLLKQHLDQSWYIIVRQNPMDTSDKWSVYFKNCDNVFINKPKWIMDNVSQLNYTQADDLIEYGSLLSYCDICVNIPSTVTLEAAIKHKPVINIAYEFHGVNNTTNSRLIKEFWEADYYKPYRKFDFVIPLFSDYDLAEVIKNLHSISHKLYFDYDICTKEILQENSFEKSMGLILDDSF